LATGVLGAAVTPTVSVLIFVPVLLAFLGFELIRYGWRSGKQQVSLGRAEGSSDSSTAPLSQAGREPLWTVVALVLGGLLAGIFWFPMVAERSYIVESQWVTSTYQYASNFVYPSQFFDFAWGYGYSVPGPNDATSFQLGIMTTVGAVIGTLAALGLLHRDRKPEGVLEDLRYGGGGVTLLEEKLTSRLDDLLAGIGPGL
jgi:hypothetical protein